MLKCGAWLAALGLALTPALGSAGDVYVATIDGSINPAVSNYLDQVINEAHAANAAAIVLELDTPGGLLTTTEDMVKAILNAPVPVIVYVSPRGAHATSAGVFITLAGHVAAMAPGTSIGAAHPVPGMPSVNPEPPPAEPAKGDGEKARPRPLGSPEIMAEKVENYAVAFIESIAELRERNVEWAAQAVRTSEALTQKEALELNVVDLEADDLAHLLERVHGREVLVGRDKAVLATQGARIVRVEMKLVNRVMNVLSEPNIAFLLLLLGLGGLYMEFSNPGVMIGGVVGVLSLILLGLSLQILPFNSIGLILILLGVGMMTAELFLPTLGALFAAGVISLGIGGYVLFDVPELSDLSVSVLSVLLPAVLSFAAFGAVLVFGVARSYQNPQAAGQEAMIGMFARADSDLDPSGRVFVHGEYWNAEATEPIRSGERVRIVDVDDLLLRVSRVADLEGNS